MSDYKRVCFRMASLLQERLGRLQLPEMPVDLPWWEWKRCEELRRKLERAHSRNFHAAAASLARDLEATLLRLRENFSDIVGGQQARAGNRSIPPVKELYAEMCGVSDEFETVEYNLRRRLIVVTTDVIELEDVCLGEFEIRLDLNDFGKLQPYRVVASEPNPAAEDSSITHPHIKDNKLCEGEGRFPIRRAL